MQSREEDSSKAKTIIKIEDTEENGVVAQADSGPPTLEKMLADPIKFRRYVKTLADATPQAPPELYGDAFKKWQYRHLLTATLDHLLAVFKDRVEPRQTAWQFYQAWLIVNNTDYKDSPFFSFASAKSLFVHESIGRRMCARVARGLSETPEKGERKERGRKRGDKEGGSGRSGGKSMLE